MTIKAAVIGCGNISKYHFSGLEKSQAQVKWICDLNRDAAIKWQSSTGAEYTADYRRIIEDKEIDLINLTCATSAHYQICMDAIDAGKAVICEKTLALNASDAYKIVSAAQKKGTLFYTSYMKRFLPAIEQAKQLIPELGKIIAADFRSCQGWGIPGDKVPSDGVFAVPAGGESFVRKAYGGGILVCGGSHILDLVGYLLGKPSSISAAINTPAGYDIDLNASMLLEIDSCPVYVLALAHPLKKAGYFNNGWDERFEINGINGRLEFYGPNWTDHTVNAPVLIHYDNRTGATTEYHYDACSPFDRAITAFCRDITAGQQQTQSSATGYYVDQLIESAKQSAAEGKKMLIDWKL